MQTSKKINIYLVYQRQKNESIYVYTFDIKHYEERSHLNSTNSCNNTKKNEASLIKSKLYLKKQEERDLNPRPIILETIILPTELPKQNKCIGNRTQDQWIKSPVLYR